jgi:hypothetical protein
MKPVWVSSFYQRMGELCVCDLCTALESRSQVSVWQCYVKALLPIARMGNGVHYRLSPKYSFMGRAGY